MKKNLVFLLLIIICKVSHSQSVTVTPNGIEPMPPLSISNMTYDEMQNIENPTTGSLIFDTTFQCLRYFNGEEWICLLTSNNPTTPLLSTIKQGGTGNDVVMDIAIDNIGNVYITGTFEGTMQIGNILLSAAGGKDVFLAKYDALGVVQWAKKAGGAGDDYGRKLAFDSGSGIYLIGFFTGNASFENYNLTSNGYTDMFIAKYFTGNGNIFWINQGGGPKYDYGFSVIVNQFNQIFITGQFTESFSYGNNVVLTGYPYYNSGFIANISQNGNMNWIKKTTNQSISQITDIETDGANILYITGYFHNTLSIDNLTITSNNTTSGEIFVAKYNTSTSTWDWGISFGSSGFDIPFALALYNSDLYLSGYFSNSIAFGSTTLISNGNFDAFLVKLNANTTQVLWAKGFGGIGPDSIEDICMDGAGNILATGFFSDNASFDWLNLNGYGLEDIFFAKFAGSDGKLIWATNAGSAENMQRGLTIARKGNKIYAAGYYKGNARFGNSILQNNSANGTTDFFITRIENP